MPLLTTLRNKISGFADSLPFSNRWQIILQRLLRPSDPLVTYCWKGKWWLVCDTRVQDAQAAKELLANGCYDRWIRKSMCEGKLSYVNVGANIGAFDLAVAAAVREIPFGLSIELSPRTFARLSFNLQVNGLHQIRMLNAGVSRENGTFSFHPTACSLSDGLFAHTPADLVATSLPVPLLTLADALARAGLEEHDFDLLKLDCEGAEYGIVAASSPDCLRRFRHIVAELHPEPVGESPSALYAKLAQCGFQPDRADREGHAGLHFWCRT